MPDFSNTVTSRYSLIDEKKITDAEKGTIVFSLEPQTLSGLFISTSSPGEIYNTKLTSCSCIGNRQKGYLCKHMIRLAMILGVPITYLHNNSEIRSYSGDGCIFDPDIEREKSENTTKPSKNDDSKFDTHTSLGCCSRMVECSDKKQCTQPNFEISKGCLYRKNLEHDRIFYGVNRNFDPSVHKEPIPDLTTTYTFDSFLNNLSVGAIRVGDTVLIDHAAYGALLFDTAHLDLEQEQWVATLCLHSTLPDRLPFDQPKGDPANLPGRRTNYPAKTRDYGCNYWYRSDLRRWLNSLSDNELCCGSNGRSLPGFLAGFSESVRQHIVPTENITYSGAMPKAMPLLYPVPEYIQLPPMESSGKCEYTSTTDFVFLPSHADISLRCPKNAPAEYKRTFELFKDSKHKAKSYNGFSCNYRLRDAEIGDTTGYLAATYTIYGFAGGCNATAPTPIAPMLRVK